MAFGASGLTAHVHPPLGSHLQSAAITTAGCRLGTPAAFEGLIHVSVLLLAALICMYHSVLYVTNMYMCSSVLQV